MSAIHKGTVKWFNNAKGFGFIEHHDGKDVFVHYSVIQTNGFKTLKDGEPVEYELSEGDKGLHAMKVFRVNEVQTGENKVDNSSGLNVQVEVDRAPQATSLQQGQDNDSESEVAR